MEMGHVLCEVETEMWRIICMKVVFQIVNFKSVEHAVNTVP
jgi:hypothetical protein